VADRLTVGVAARLSRYLQVLTQARKMGRDLAAFGKFGKRGVGYNIDSLLGEIRKILRTQGQHNIALIGAGRLGQAIASSPIFAEHGINIAAVFDNDESKIGSPIGNVAVSPYPELAETVHEKNIIVGVLAVPATAAQQAADDLVRSGVKIIFNYSEALLETPSDVTVHTSNPAVELLYALYFHLT
jgi:redox-sensing transcriptional repressor